MCGIFGYVAVGRRDATSVLEGLKYLEYRGYDSWGIAAASNGQALVQKEVGKIAGAETHLPATASAIGHTRWATHGGVTQANAHPHTDCTGRLALIHNGIVENYRELGSLLCRDHMFRSQTDTEVLVHLLEEELVEGRDLLSALIAVFRRVEGLSAVAVLDAETGEIAVVKNGSPLVLGQAEGATFLASDALALLDHTRRITFLEDGQAARLTGARLEVRDVATGSRVEPEVRIVTWDARRAGLDGHDHFMSKEIHEQPDVLRRLAISKRQDVDDLAAMVARARDVYLIGCGTAHHAALSGRYLFADLAGRNVAAAAASEMSLIYPLLGPDSLVIALSQSGETIDVLEAARAARVRGARVAALVNAESSALDRFADRSVLLECGPERCVLATKSYTAMLAVLQMTARALRGNAESGAAEILEAGDRLGTLLRSRECGDAILGVAQTISDHQHLFALGRHANFPLALEAALKIKEVSYMHAEGFASGELKHGVIALIAPGTPCLIFAPDGTFRREALAAAAEVRARGAYTVGLSPTEEDEFSARLPVSGSPSSPYEMAVVAQWLAYELALLRGCDPDRPRNLAKSVTVK